MTEIIDQSMISKFVGTCLCRINNDDTAFRAAMTRADNPATESQSWRYLVPFCNLELDIERGAFALVGAAIAREKPEANGKRSLGLALRSAKNDPDDDSIDRKVQRLLACSNRSELIPVLRPILRFLNKQENTNIDYIALLRDIISFSEKTKLRWAKQYYKYQEEQNECT